MAVTEYETFSSVYITKFIVFFILKKKTQQNIKNQRIIPKQNSK